MIINQFFIDEDNSIDDDLVIDIAGKGTVIINSNSDLVAVSIYPLHVVDKPIFSEYVLNEDFMEDKDGTDR